VRNTKHSLLISTALLCLPALTEAEPYDAPQTGLPEAVQSHIDSAYLILKGDVSRGNLPSTLYLVDDKTFASPIPAARKLASQPATKAFDQFYYLGINTVSAWALNTGDGIILFDTLNNPEEAAEHIEGGLRQVGLDPSKIKYIVLTHGHGDHTGGAKYLQEKYHARVLMSGIDWDIVLKDAASGSSRFGPPPGRDISITDGQKLTLGGTTISFHLTPGHTPGTVSTLIPVTDHGKRHVISFIGGTGLNTVKEPSRDGGRILRESLDKFAKLSLDAGADVVIASHPFLDDSWVKAKLVNDGDAGKTRPWVAGSDAVLRYYAATIEAVYAIEAHDRLKPLVIAQAASAQAASAQSGSRLDAFVGRWQMNAAKTKMGRMGPTGKNLVRSPTFTWIFTPEGPGLRMDVYAEYPLPAATRTMTMIADGKPRPCEGPAPCLTTGGDPKDQSYTYYPIESRMVARLFYDKGQVVEYSTYAVSPDGKTFTSISWSPETPEYQNIQVFDKQP
jgi:metallo-beta-lactamase class B